MKVIDKEVIDNYQDVYRYLPPLICKLSKVHKFLWMPLSDAHSFFDWSIFDLNEAQKTDFSIDFLIANSIDHQVCLWKFWKIGGNWLSNPLH